MVPGDYDDRRRGEPVGVRGEFGPIGSSSVGEAYSAIEPFDGDGFAYPVESKAQQSIDVDTQAAARTYMFPEGIDAQVFDYGFKHPAAEDLGDVSSFEPGMTPVESGSSPFAERSESVDDDLEFHQSVGMVMDEGEMGSRTTISDQSLSSHHYHGPLEGVRYP